jgi:hypothetical protein
VFASCSWLIAWLVVVCESEKLLCAVLFVNKELGKVGHKKDGTNAFTAGNGGRRGWTPAASVQCCYFEQLLPACKSVHNNEA